MVRYQRSQTGYLMVFAMFFVAALYASILSQADARAELAANPIASAIMPLVLVILASFLWLKVTIDESYLRIKFGYGIFRKKFLIRDIVSVKSVKNHWYYGWGIRWRPGTWIYNVSGFDAVEIKMKNGKIYRIGTDEPQALEAAVKEGMNV